MESMISPTESTLSTPDSTPSTIITTKDSYQGYYKLFLLKMALVRYFYIRWSLFKINIARKSKFQVISISEKMLIQLTRILEVLPSILTELVEILETSTSILKQLKEQQKI